jgi:hypothetical protein
MAWWLQVVLVAGFAVAPTVFGLAYLRSVDPFAVGALAVFAAVTVVLVRSALRGRATAVLGALGALAAATVVGLLVVLVHLAAPDRNMAAFLRDLDRHMAPGEPVTFVGDVDETVHGIVPFVTGRRLVIAELGELETRHPECVLVQNNSAGRTAPTLPPPYELMGARTFGPERYLAFWCRGDDSSLPAASRGARPSSLRLSMAGVAE